MRKHEDISARPLRIGVIGCGIAGSAAATLLARRGHHVTILEQSPQVGPVGAGILLQPSGQVVLRRMGLLDEVTSTAERITHLHAVTHRGRTLTHLSYNDVFAGCIAYGLHRGDLFTALHRAVLEAGVQVQLNCTIAALSHTRANGTVMARDARGQEFGPFDVLIGADGSRSTSRRISGLQSVTYPYSFGAMWAIGHTAAVSGKLYQVTHGTRRLCGLLPMGGGRVSLFWGVANRDRAALLDRGIDHWRNDVAHLCPVADELLSQIRCFDDVRFTTYQHVWMPRWHDGNRTILIGDAAHACSPHLGQGASLALMDAEALVECLSTCESIPEAFHQYTLRRRRYLRYVTTVSFLLAPFFQSPGWVKGCGRDLALPILPRLPIIGRQILTTMAGLKRGFFRGASGS